MAALCGNMLTVSVLLSVFCLSGAQPQCDKKPALYITAPKQMKALSGSCLQIPCSFRETPGENPFDSSRETFGVWIKSDSAFENNIKNVIFNSSKTQNIYNIKITGDLKERNCTTVFYDVIRGQEDKYFFRIENRPFMATASCHPVHMTVRDSAWSPKIEISADVKKKNSVTITCSALTPCPHSPPELSWDHQADSLRQMERNTNGSFTSKIQQSITLSDTHDGYNISCSVTYPVKDASALMSAGSWFYLSCSSRTKYPISSYTWFNISKHRVTEAAEGALYTYDCEEDNSSSQLQISLISVIVVLLILGLALCVWFFKFKHLSPQTIQNQTAVDLVPQAVANNPEEDVQYGDVNFFKKKPGAASVSVHSSRRQEEETVYSQVKVSPVENSSLKTANQDLYAQVKKH